MKPRPATIDESPLSEFITKMRDAHLRRLAADSVAGKRAIDREVVGLMRQYLGGKKWEEAQRALDPNVPRATRRGRGRFTAPSKYAGDPVDRKLAAAGGDRDDE